MRAPRSTRRSRWPRVLLGLTAVLLVLVTAWTVVVQMPGSSFRGRTPALTEAERESRVHLEQHVKMLSGRIGERNSRRRAALDSAAAYIENQFEDLGYDVSLQEFSARGGRFLNVEVSILGADSSSTCVVVGAHYDTVFGSPGADDNASGVAALLDLARLLKGQHLARTVRLVAFANEEAPYFGTQMGSRYYAHHARLEGESIVAMLSLESIGYFVADPGSQHYPSPLGLVYPTRGNFLAFVGNLDSRRLVRESIRAFRAGATVPSEGLAAPNFMRDISRSDHASFWREGYPAIMITDTAPFRNPSYHGKEDMPEQLDYDALARVTSGVERVVRALAGA